MDLEDYEQYKHDVEEWNKDHPCEIIPLWEYPTREQLEKFGIVPKRKEINWNKI